MTLKNSVVFMFSIMCLFATATHASPRNVNSVLKFSDKLNLTPSQKIAQQAQIEAASDKLKHFDVHEFFAEQNKKKAKKKALKKSLRRVSKRSKKRKISKKYRNKGRSYKTAMSSKGAKSYNKRLHVTATAYTSHVNQTDSTPNIAAWGDRLKPGMKVIAVSRDLLNVYGLKHRQKVRIKGLKGEYMVLDKMNKRWRKKIDIYMGMNKRKAFRWGRRKVEILWNS